MAFVRCAKHGRIYDDTKDAGCPLCVQDAAMPRAPGSSATKEPDPEGAKSRGLLIVLGVLVIVALIIGGVSWYSSTHNAQTRAQARRDSLRAIAAGPAGPDTMTFALPNDLSPVRRARALRASLESIVKSSRGAVLGWPEGPVDTASADRATQRRAKQYAAFAKRWNDRLDAITRGGTEFRYAPGVRMHDQMDNVTNQLQAALSVIRDMVRPNVIKSRTERSDDFRAAAGYLNAAGSVLSNLPR